MFDYEESYKKIVKKPPSHEYTSPGEEFRRLKKINNRLIDSNIRYEDNFGYPSDELYNVDKDVLVVRC